MRFEPTISWLAVQYSNHYTTEPSMTCCGNHVDLIQKVQRIYFWQMKCLVMKFIWYLQTWIQKCTRREVQQILFGKFDLGHPVEVEKTLVSIWTIFWLKTTKNGSLWDIESNQFQIRFRKPNFSNPNMDALNKAAPSLLPLALAYLPISAWIKL